MFWRCDIRDCRDMNKPAPLITLAATVLPDGDGAPEWIHLIPGGDGALIPTVDGDARGPYRLVAAQAVIAASLDPRRLGGRLPIDVNHSIDKLGKLGGESPARGWITALEARADGIWARVEWTAEGARMVAAREYRGISPVISAPDGTIQRIWRAGLTNDPALLGLVSLNSAEIAMTLKTSLAELVGLTADAEDDALLGAVRALKGGDASKTTLTALSAELGVDGADLPMLLAAIRLNKAASADVVALTARLATAETGLATLTAVAKRAASEAFIDGAIADKRVGVRADNRNDLITLHMEQPATVEKLIGGMPKLGPTALSLQPPGAKDGVITLSSEQVAAAAALGVSTDAYLKTLKEEAA